MNSEKISIKHPKGHGYIDRWESVGDFVRYAQSVGSSSSAFSSVLGVGFSKACKMAMEGQPELIAVTREKLDVLQNLTAIERLEYKTVRSVMGTRVNVGDYLTGSPVCMRQRKRVAKEVKYVRVYVAIATNCTVSHQQVLNRGVYILAFLEALRSLRINCDVFLMSDTGGTGNKDSWQVIKVDSNPLDLSVSGFAIAHPAFANVLTFSTAARLIGFSGRAPHSWSTQSWDHYNEVFMPEILKMEPDDVYIRELKSGDPFLKDPDKWLSDALSKFTKQ